MCLSDRSPPPVQLLLQQLHVLAVALSCGRCCNCCCCCCHYYNTTATCAAAAAVVDAAAVSTGDAFVADGKEGRLW